MSSHDHSYHTLGKFTPDAEISLSMKEDELKAARARIDELKASLAEMVGVYWGEGDGHEPPPACIQRAQVALAEEVR